MAQAFYQAVSSLPCELASLLSGLPPQQVQEITEIRLRALAPVVLHQACGRAFLSREGKLTQTVCGAFCMTQSGMQECFHASVSYTHLTLPTT